MRLISTLIALSFAISHVLAKAYYVPEARRVEAIHGPVKPPIPHIPHHEGPPVDHGQQQHSHAAHYEKTAGPEHPLHGPAMNPLDDVKKPQSRAAKAAAAAKFEAMGFANSKEMKELLPATKQFDVMQDTLVFRGPGPLDVAVGKAKRPTPQMPKMYYVVKRWYSKLNPRSLQCHAHSDYISPNDWSKLKLTGRSQMGGQMVKGLAGEILTHEPFTKLFHHKTMKAEADQCRTKFGDIFHKQLKPQPI